MKMLKERVCLTIDENILDKMKLLAEKDDRSLSQYVNMLFKEHISDKDLDFD